MTALCFTAAILPGISFCQDDLSMSQMMSNVQQYNNREKYQEEFRYLCETGKTAYINGRTSTGSGLYILMDVSIFSRPGGTMIGALPDNTIVLLTGESADVGKKHWVKIKFLSISSYTGSPAGIGEGWVDKTRLKSSKKRK